MSDAPIVLHHRLAPEDQARAEFYALLSRLYADVPDAPLLAAVASAPSLGPATRVDDASEAGGLAVAWEALRAASAAVDLETAAAEFLALFVGVGRSEVSLYASHYLGPQSGRPLAELRATLSRLGLARRSDKSEFEDHLAVVLETMRMLVAGDDERHPAEIADQQAFFDRHVASWAFDCCSAIRRCAIANYYVRVAEFTSCFLALERDSFAIE